MEQKPISREGKKKPGRKPRKVVAHVVGTPCDDGLKAVAERMYQMLRAQPKK